MPSPPHPVLLAQLCKSCPSLKRQLVLQVGRKRRRECLGRRQQEMHSITLLEEPRGLEELPEPLAGAEGTQGIDSSGGGKGGQWHGRPPAHGTGVHRKQGAHTQSLARRRITRGVFPLQLPHGKYSPQADYAQTGNLRRAMEQEKPGSAGWNGDTSCNSKEVWGGRGLRESLSPGELAGLYTAHPAYLPCSRACTRPVSYILLLSI